MKFPHRPCFVLLAFFLAMGGAFAQNSVQVAFQNTAETLIRDASKSPLPVGESADGDGAAIQLGYYNEGTTSSPFSGSFVALTGPDSANQAFKATSVGDSGGGALGRFSLVCNFIFSAPRDDTARAGCGNGAKAKSDQLNRLTTATAATRMSPVRTPTPASSSASRHRDHPRANGHAATNAEILSAT